MENHSNQPHGAQSLPKGVDLEYNALRDEILQRIKLRQDLMNYSLLLSSGLLAYGVNYPLAILLYPPFAFFLSLGWLQHDYRIRDISGYIKTKIEPYFKPNGWETYIRDKPNLSTAFRFVVFSHGGVFFVTQIIAIFVGWKLATSSIVTCTLIIFDVFAVLGVLWIWWLSIKHRLPPKYKTSNKHSKNNP